MIKFRDMMDMVINGQDSIICAVKDANTDNAAIDEMLLTGKYWIRKVGNGEIFPAMPDELMEAESGMTWGTSASYLILAPNFDQESYWATAPTNPPLFHKRTCFSTDISCERILELDKANMPVVELFNALADAYELSPEELMGYLVQKL